MHVERTITYGADLQSVQAVLASQELAQARADAGELAAPSHTLKEADSAPHAVTVVTVPASRLPDKAKRLISKDTVVTITQAWDGTGPNKATAAFTIDVGSLPVKVALTQTLVADGDRTTSTYSGDVKVSVPIIGAKLEKVAASKVDQLLAGDQKLVNGLLEKR